MHPRTPRSRAPFWIAASVILIGGCLAAGLAGLHHGARASAPAGRRTRNSARAARTGADERLAMSRTADVDGDGRPDRVSIDQPARDRLSIALGSGGTESLALPASGKNVWGLRPPVSVPGAAGQVVVVDVFSGDFDHGLPIGMVDGRPAVLRLPPTPALGNGPGTETEASGFRTGFGYGVYGSRLVSFETGLRHGVQGPDGTYWTWKLVADRLVPVLSPHACVLAAGAAQPRC